MENKNLPACIPTDSGCNRSLFHPRAWLYYIHSSNPGTWHQQQSDLIAIARDAGYEIVGCTGDLPHKQGVWFRHLRKPGLAGMRRAVRKGQVDVVIVTRLSQLSNHKRKLKKLLLFLRRHDVAVHTMECQLGYDLYRHGLDGLFS